MQPLPIAEGAEAHARHRAHKLALSVLPIVGSEFTQHLQGKNNLHEPNTQLQVKLKALTD